MGNRFIKSDGDNIHLIEKGPREKSCSVCETDLVNEHDTMVMLDAEDTHTYPYHFYVCKECLKKAYDLAFLS